MSNKALWHDQIQKLETELSVYKRAYVDVDGERRRLETFKEEAEKQMGLLENQLKGHRVIALLDGDGAIFTSELIARGQAGGHAAAQMLSDSILQYLTSNYGAHQYQLWVYIFFNKRGLIEAFGRFGNVKPKAKFEEFYMGFNQAAEKFLMVDVGSVKEAADAKIKAHLENDIRLPQTFKVIFGGCHDNGYVTNLRSQITAGFKQKLILLRGYAELATGIADLDLPVLTVPDLFLSQKLGATRVTPTVSAAPLGLGPTSSYHVGPVQSAVPVAIPLVLSENEETPCTIPELMVEFDIFSQRHLPIPFTGSSAVRTTQKRPPTPDLDSGSSTASDTTDEVLDQPPVPTFRPRHINPKIPLSKHRPPPCTLFYLTNCKHGADCKYAHDYILEPEHFAEIRLNAKKSPCPAINKNEFCVWGDDCCHGHYCPQGPKCHFFKQGRCKFTGVDVHKEPKSQNGESP